MYWCTQKNNFMILQIQMELKTLLELREISFMNKLLVTESADILCYKAEKDIMTVDTLYNKPKYPEYLMYDIICSQY